jgi:hypothetical protein
VTSRRDLGGQRRLGRFQTIHRLAAIAGPHWPDFGMLTPAL